MRRLFENSHGWKTTACALLIIFLFSVVFPGDLTAQGTRADYDRWGSLNSRINQPIFRDNVIPKWIDEPTGLFSYHVQVAKDETQFVLVDAVHRTRQAFQTQDQLNAELSKRSQATSANLQLTSLAPQNRIERSRNGGERAKIEFKNETDVALFYKWVTTDGRYVDYGKVDPGKSAALGTFAGHSWVLEKETGERVASFVADAWQPLAVINSETPEPQPLLRRRADRSDPSGPVSPDSHWRVEFAQNNVLLIDNRSEDRYTLSGDGQDRNGYSGQIAWSPDSKHFVVMKTERVEVRKISMIKSSPKNSIHSEVVTIPYAKPGDPVDHPHPVLFSINETEPQNTKPRWIADSLFPNPYAMQDLKWHEDSQSFSFLYNQRGHQTLRVIKVDAGTAEPRIMIDETSDTFVCYSHKKFLRRIDSTNEAIWMSERSGWNHLYLIDQQTGEIKNAITEGEWIVREVERVDEEKRQMWLVVSGIDPDQDPYYRHLVRVDFDGQNMVRLTAGNGDHSWEFSPQNQYLIDTYSRVDLPSIRCLRDGETGELLCDLEQADASKLLETGWQYPERFVAKGRDGETDIYGIIIRPTNFDPEKAYPVLEAIYAGPQSAYVPKSFGKQAGLQKMAELGFVIVKMDGMGTSFRSKAFHDVCWKNLGDSGFADRIAWIKAAAKERPEMDLTRVGIWGGSAGGQSAMRALVAHHDFYHAAVADCGCHDNRVDKMWWNEQWMGYPIDSHYKDQSNVTGASQLEGDLMLIVGELDNNVDPASTMQVVDALVKANKDFEFLIVPGAGHGAAGHSYAERRQADFFIRKLWKAEPRR